MAVCYFLLIRIYTNRIQVARQYKTVIINKYGGFFKEDDPIIEQLVRKAAAEMMNFVRQYNVPVGKETAMVELALFDMVVVCGEYIENAEKARPIPLLMN